MQCFGRYLVCRDVEEGFSHKPCKVIILGNSVTMRGSFSATAAISSRTRFGCRICAMHDSSICMRGSKSTSLREQLRSSGYCMLAARFFDLHMRIEMIRSYAFCCVIIE